jgi:hypothetical protein
MSNTNDVIKKLAGSEANDLGGIDTVNKLFSNLVVYKKAAVDTTLLETYTLKVWTNPYDFPVRIARIVYNPDATLTANTSNYATITIETDDAANGANATAAAVTTSTVAGGGTGNFVADTQVLFPASAYTVENTDVVPGANIFLTVAKAGAGILVPAGVLNIVLYKL